MQTRVLGQGANHGRRADPETGSRRHSSVSGHGEQEGSQEACLLQGHGTEEIPQEAPAHVFSPGQPHFPVSTAPVCLDKAVSTPHGHTPLQTQRSPAHPGDRCPRRKTRSITHPAQQAVETDHRRAPRECPWSWAAAGGGEDSQQRVTEGAGGRWGGPLGASRSQVWKPASSSVERRRQEWEIQKYTLCINQGSTRKRQNFRLKSHLLKRPKGDPEASEK